MSVRAAYLAMSTEEVARELHYRAALGPPLLKVGEVGVYAPWAWIHWEREYGRLAPVVFRSASAITTVAAVLGALVALLLTAFGRKASAPSQSHGSSRWATTGEMKAAGLLGGVGVVLCQTADASFRTGVDGAGRTKTRATKLGRLLRHDGPEHVLPFAPTRSGKGVGLV